MDESRCQHRPARPALRSGGAGRGENFKRRGGGGVL